MTDSIFSSRSHAELQQERQGIRLAAYLSLNKADVPHDISEQLRAARQRALAARKQVRAVAPALLGAGNTSPGWQIEEPVSWWDRIGSLIPLLALVGGLLLINSIQNDSRARELAEVDLALLTDELPVAAFADPGFLQFLKTEN